MSKAYYEDINVHQKYRSREYHLEEDEIISYARQWDPQPFHIDPEFAKTTIVGSLFASGVHVLAICIKLENERTPPPAWIASLGWDKIRFLSPARPGDVLRLENEVLTKRESNSVPNTGILHFETRLINQRGEPVVTLEATGLIEKRPKT